MTYIIKAFGSFFYTGYFPVASGTVGSFLAFIIYFFIPGFESLHVMIPVIVVTSIIGIWTGNRFEEYYGKDPSECTIDEAVGSWISLLFLPKTFLIVVITFVLWRLFDIIKPFPANYVEKYSGGLGIMADDIVSAIYVSILMNIFVEFI